MDARDDVVGPGVAGSPRACGGKAGTGGGPVVDVAGLGTFVTLIKAEAESMCFLVLFLVPFFQMEVSSLACRHVQIEVVLDCFFEVGHNFWS